LSNTDVHNLEAFCCCYANWREAQDNINRGGIVLTDDKGRQSKNPACTVANENLRQMMSYGTTLGLDPSSRGQLITDEARRDALDGWREL